MDDTIFVPKISTFKLCWQMVNDGKERTHMMIVKFCTLFWLVLGKVEENSNLPWVKHKCTKHLHWEEKYNDRKCE
jgi:hypothetical protein